MASHPRKALIYYIQHREGTLPRTERVTTAQRGHLPNTTDRAPAQRVKRAAAQQRVHPPTDRKSENSKARAPAQRQGPLGGCRLTPQSCLLGLYIYLPVSITLIES